MLRVAGLASRAEKIYKRRQSTKGAAAEGSDHSDDDTPFGELFKKAPSSDSEEGFQVKQSLDKRFTDDPDEPIEYLVWWQGPRSPAKPMRHGSHPPTCLMHQTLSMIF